MINFNAVKVSLQEWIVRSTLLADNEVVFSDQSAPQPDKPYISIKVTSIVNIGQKDARGSIDDAGFSDFVGIREFTLSIQYFGIDALNALSILKDSLNDEVELQILRDNNIVFVEELLFADVSSLLETIWEERAQLDLLFRTTSVSSHEVGIIERMYLKPSYRNADGSSISDNSIAIQDPDAIAGLLLTIHDTVIDVVSEEVVLS